VTKTHDLPKNCAKCKSIKWDSDYIAATTAKPANNMMKETILAVGDRALEIGNHWDAKSEADDVWIEDPVTYENGEILYWRHQPKCKPVCYKRESDMTGA
jgi:hypothetical protein